METLHPVKVLEKDGYDAVAEAFNRHLAVYNARFAGDTIDLLFPQKGDSALDAAGGTGAAGIRLAERIGPEGRVTITDLSPRMLDEARKIADARSLSNVWTQVMDAEHLKFPDATFDLVICAFGVMFFPDVPRALGEAFRVLKPGGRIGYVVWSDPFRFPFFSLPATAVIRRMAPAPVRAVLKMPLVGRRILRRLLLARRPTGFSPSRFSRPGSLENLLRRAGFESVRRELRTYPIEFESFDHFWSTLMEATPAKVRMNRVPEGVMAGAREDLRRELVPGRTGSILLYNEAALILARKPA